MYSSYLQNQWYSRILSFILLSLIAKLEGLWLARWSPHSRVLPRPNVCSMAESKHWSKNQIMPVFFTIAMMFSGLGRSRWLSCLQMQLKLRGKKVRLCSKQWTIKAKKVAVFWLILLTIRNYFSRHNAEDTLWDRGWPDPQVLACTVSLLSRF